MSDVNEWVVREYFEEQGYLVSQPCKYTVGGRREKRAEEEIDLIIHNPCVRTHTIPEHFVWRTEDLEHISSAIVGIRGWHGHRVYASTFKDTPEAVAFAQPRSARVGAKRLGSPDFARILCVPKLPAGGEFKDQVINLLRVSGVDGVLAFPTMLADIVQGVDDRKNYEKSDLLQIIRLLKSYDLIKDSQLELFTKPKPRRKGKRS
ncbi:MAG: hypothetical protein OSB41_01295 [Kiritimatiellae bacterium]|nr:hypothetical protein [Kiritimatiellia bacterium]